MSSYTSISSQKLSGLTGTGKAPARVDVRIDDGFAADPGRAGRRLQELPTVLPARRNRKGERT